jgi:hypothetical protein
MSERAGESTGLRRVQRGQQERPSIWSALCRHLADKFESIGEDEGVAFSGRCGPPQPFEDSQAAHRRPAFLLREDEKSKLDRSTPRPRFKNRTWATRPTRFSSA